MGILGIVNRSENWKTAQYFSPFFKNKCAKAALAQQLGESVNTPPEEVKIELYWKGMRDYIYLQKERYERRIDQQEFVTHYTHRFPNLRQEINDFNGLMLPKERNYDVSTESRAERLFNNLSRLEIDIVLQTPKHLFIGEAKHESDFGRDGDTVLVHQLIRQYVMSTILTDMVAQANDCYPKKVIPFLVGNNLMRFDQVKFMIDQRKQCRHPGQWLKEENVLSWDCISKIAESVPADS